MPELASLEKVRQKIGAIIESNHLLDKTVSVAARPLSSQEAIGKPDRSDFPLQEGKERLIEAVVLNSKGQAFTDQPGNFQGTIKDILSLPLDDNFNRAVFTSTINAVALSLGMTSGTLHCRDDAPARCARRLAVSLKLQRPDAIIGQIGLQPAMASAIINRFGSGQVILSDLQSDMIGSSFEGVTIRNGENDNFTLIDESDVILITGTTIINNSFDALYNYLNSRKKEYMIFGITCSAVSNLLNLNRYCPFGRNN